MSARDRPAHDVGADPSAEEFLEFVETTAAEDAADPVFRERLYRRLWELARSLMPERISGGRGRH